MGQSFDGSCCAVLGSAGSVESLGEVCERARRVKAEVWAMEGCVRRVLRMLEPCGYRG